MRTTVELIVVHVVAASFPREEYLSESSGLAMSGRGKRVRSAVKTIIFNVYKYFEQQASKSKYRGPSQVTRVRQLKLLGTLSGQYDT